ncbi:hypothetical protein LTR37_018693 [Vermiconidia calcicola]|uniref:Uncharacterized protein n=1 Tax=Vermiconidia calcicola TaxID=1690605 RepID=A0ACC3MGD1_9PEZI|nr:hypothetical protein LTR37_018693 [Vermiconidia calcicola]
MARSKRSRNAAKSKLKNKRSNVGWTTAKDESTTPANTVNDCTTALAAVLATTELLEAVLLELDMKTLLLAQRVSQRFRDVIKASPTLQMKLFFRPATIKQAIKLCDISSQSGVLFLKQNAANWAKPELSELCILNPLLFTNLRAQQSNPRIDLEGLNAGRSKRGGGIVRSSWKRMYLAHGSTMEVTVIARLPNDPLPCVLDGDFVSAVPPIPVVLYSLHRYGLRRWGRHVIRKGSQVELRGRMVVWDPARCG